MLMGFLMLLHALFAFAAMFMGFLSFLVFDGMLMGFLMLLHTLFAFAAMLIGFFPQTVLALRGSYFSCIVIALKFAKAGCQPSCLDLPRLA